MLYELWFSPEFFELPGESSGAEYPHGDAPYSVYGALLALDDEQWAAICEECFPGSVPEYIDIDIMLQRVKQTNCCANLTVPVEVYIDDEGWHSVFVYDHNGRPTE